MMVRNWNKQQLGDALIQALGLPKNCISVELRIAVGKPVSVRCEYYPDPMAEVDGQKICDELQKLEMQEIQNPLEMLPS